MPGEAIAATCLIHRAVCEIRYQDGLVYLDRCGSLAIALKKGLGDPFVPSLPSMTTAELVSHRENLHVQFGHEALSVTHNFADTVARLEQVAPQAWDTLATSLEVRKKVVRAGARFWLTWSADSVEAGEAALQGSGLFAETQAWEPIFGRPDRRSFTAVREAPESGPLRVALSVVELKQGPGEIPERLLKFAPPVAVLVDLDYALKVTESPFDLRRETVKQFIRASWSSAETVASRVRERLG